MAEGDLENVAGGALCVCAIIGGGNGITDCACVAHGEEDASDCTCVVSGCGNND